jgi:hypothetical protein
LAALATIAFLSLPASSANAQRFGWYATSRPVYQTSYYTVPRTTYYTPGFGASSIYVENDHADVWHDTSHLHYRPATFIRHGNHFDYVPGGYELHRTGHWDHVHP